MPALVLNKILGNLKFYSYRIQLPREWRPPKSGPDRQQYLEALGEGAKGTPPRLVPPWFVPAEAHFQATCDEIGAAYRDAHDTLIDAVGFAHNLWRLQAHFEKLSINGPLAVGAAGCLTGPSLEAAIKQYPPCAGWTGNGAAYRDAVAAGVARAFGAWQAAVTVPALPWYPAFASFSAPVAPPTPNVPSPLTACISAQATQVVTPEPLKGAMIAAYDPARRRADPYHEALFDAIATVLSMAFATWISIQQVAQVLGQGPVPTFLPPVNPSGPVTGGQSLAIPGHLMS